MIPAWSLAAGVVAVFAVFIWVERAVPLRKRVTPVSPRLFTNAALTALAFGTAGLTVRPAVMFLIERNAATPTGLMQVGGLPGAAKIVLAFLAMDLSFYWWHRLNHGVPFLWRFHNVHHIDPDLDVSTGFRFHAGEVALSAIFRALQVALIGVSPGVFFAYEVVFQANTLFHHSNSRLPIRLERVLHRLLVTPRMHGIHHSQVRAETDSNFSVVFPWWDRLHRTLRLNVPQARVEIGVPGYALPEDNGILRALVMPFRPQRLYWRRPDGSPTGRGPSDRVDGRRTLAA